MKQIKRFRPSKEWYFVFLLLIWLAELSYYFYQYLSFPLDGDMSGGVMHTGGVEEIFADPFGLKMIFNNTAHVNPNRFFSHWMFSSYFRTMPFLFQSFGVHPIESIYLSAAVCKLGIQGIISFTLGFYISRERKWFNKKQMLAIILIMPLFQSYGYYQTIGIIDQSITYNFFYSLPLALLLIYLLPIWRQIVFNQKIRISWVKYLFYALLAIALPLSGPIIPGLILIVTLLLCSFYFIECFKMYSNEKLSYRLVMVLKSIIAIPKFYFWFLIPTSIFSIYSLWLGTYNTINIVNILPLATLYNKLIHGVIGVFTINKAVTILLTVIFLNLLFLRNTIKMTILKKKLFFFGISFVVLYLLLLPLGGYRVYRPFIIRYDTFMPITIVLLGHIKKLGSMITFEPKKDDGNTPSFLSVTNRLISPF